MGPASGAAPRILASTTAHKREPLLPTLELLGRLGLRDLDLNLHHLIEGGVSASSVAAAADVHALHIRALSGGWCDFYHRAPEIENTFASVARQVGIAGELHTAQLRLFFGRLRREEYSPRSLDVVSGNLSRLSDAHPGMTFVFENHDGASLDPAVCREILDRVARPNIRLNFDPINFAREGVDPLNALGIVRPLVAHVHLKGLEGGEYCEFGEGD